MNPTAESFHIDALLPAEMAARAEQIGVQKASLPLGKTFVLSDIVEEVYLNAFDAFPGPARGRLTDWIDQLIDPSIQKLMIDPDAERERIRYFRDLWSREA